MNKFINTRALVSILIVVCLIVGLIIMMRSCGRERIVYASISSNDIVLGDSITFADSTSRAKSWLWEFGNGNYSSERAGTYKFPETGRYQVRLKVNDELEKTFLVQVRPKASEEYNEHLIHINAPSSAMQGEYILFSAEGNDRDWRWEFGESSVIDSREKTPIYAYDKHGIFIVKLSTEKTQYPITHRIEIFPKYMENDSTDMMTMAGNDIKEKLQNIANGKSFNTNYNHILNKYLCKKPEVLVTVNNTKRNDFYSYCQGLRLTGRGTTIEAVFVESKNPEGKQNNSENNPESNNIEKTICIDHIIILQYAPGETTSQAQQPTNENNSR
ncbi:PKD domain-containing protein [Bacteroides sp. 224]|uniref:PKD domain-containing protein n=1 Tax=Bacteroides sp. 224 TaxID=2302936 RepID=UPI0013D641AE|nr:PKD domain-containing protein [Bacteroides sp. 224]NDV64665.1 PKD domain-containing protein [Bacteroides sp. 224]